MRTMTTNCRLIGILAGCAITIGCSDDTDPVDNDYEDGSASSNERDAAGNSGGSNASSSSTLDSTEVSTVFDGSWELDASILDASLADATSGDASDAALSDAGDASVPEFPDEATVANAALPAGFVAWEWASGLQEPRGVTVSDDGTLLVVEQDGERISALWDEDNDGVSGSNERAVIASAPGLNHGIALNGGFLYASSDGFVYRWAYNEGHTDLGQPTEVVTGIPSGGNHTSRTLLFDDVYLYVTVGSAANVDDDSSRAQIRRFLISDLGASRAFGSGELFADGLRNEVGLAIDGFGHVWGVENGMDDLEDSDLGGDIHNTNPGEELNLFATAGAFYGYPYCWSEYAIPGDAGAGAGAQWWLEGSAIEAADAGTSDEWCQDPDNVVPPALVFPAHVAPLDIHFYSGSNFPAEYAGDALVTFHGSWNTEPPIGYKVVRVEMDSTGMPTGVWEPLYEFEGATDTGTGWNDRPVGLATLPNGTLLVTSDHDADRIVAIRYVGLDNSTADASDL
jgi:glucose/arabinose dehydrogenase